MIQIREDVCTEFISLQNNLKALVSSKGLTINKLSKRVGIPRSTFDHKLRNKSFLGAELLTIVQELNKQ